MSIKGVKPSCHLMCLFTLELQITFTVICVCNLSGTHHSQKSLLTYLQFTCEIVKQAYSRICSSVAVLFLITSVSIHTCIRYCKLSGGFSTSMTSNYLVVISHINASTHSYLLLRCLSPYVHIQVLCHTSHNLCTLLSFPLVLL